MTSHHRVRCEITYKKQKAYVNYNIKTGQSYLINNINYDKIKSLKTSYTSGSKKYVRYYEVKEVNTYESIDVYVLDIDNKLPPRDGRD